jgi:serine/threonine-protein kinase
MDPARRRDNGGNDPMTKQSPGYILADRYRIERRLGAGTSATVFEATDTLTGKRVAVKVVHHLFRKDRTIRKRFLREAEAARALSTPHAVKVLDVGQLSHGIPYLVMELLHGSTLERIIRRNRGVPIEQAMLLTDQIAAALQDAHGIDIIHRDLKPENIFVTDLGGGPFVKVVDFGISKLMGNREASQLTGTGVLVGTPVYMAPEQIEGHKDLDGRADVYSLGVVMFEMLAGVSPFASAKDFPGLLRLLLGEPRSVREHRPDVPEGLASVIAQAMAPNRARRLPNMESLRLGIAPYWRGRPSMASYGSLSMPEGRSAPPPGLRPQLDSLFDEDEDESVTRRKVEPFRLGSLFDEEEADLATRREANPFRGGSEVPERPEVPAKEFPPPARSEVPPPAKMRSEVPPPARTLPKAPLPPLPLRGPAPRPSRPPAPGLVPSPSPAIRRPPQSPAPTEQRRRDETDLVWPPRDPERGDA